MSRRVRRAVYGDFGGIGRWIHTNLYCLLSKNNNNRALAAEEKSSQMTRREIGIIDSERLKNVPPKFRANHEFCFRLHDQMTSLLVEGEKSGAHLVGIKFTSASFAEKFAKLDDPLGALLAAGEDKLSRKIITNHLTVALFSDMLHFIYESLKALEKRKFSVAFALLRKPLRENLMFATWLKADQADFIRRLKSSPADLMESRQLSASRRTELLKSAIENSKGMEFSSAETIYEIIFDKSSQNGFATLFDKANHLVTSHRSMRTEELNLNFIFKNPYDNDIYENIYKDLSYVLMYANVLMISMYSDMSAMEEKYLDYILITSLGSYSSLFVQGRNKIASEINKILKEFLHCPHCGEKLSINKSNATRFFLTENINCHCCDGDHHFPFYWLLSKAGFRLKTK
ncbi:UNVERIFIED_ORG: hypothetical protein J2W19_003660 [Shinella zoogloeoides]|nr:hypothetical protein [Shinella zoogloeoides]